MRKLLYAVVFVLFVSLLLCYGCTENTHHSPQSTVKYQSTEMVVHGQIQDWSTEDIEQFLKMINDASWEYSITKTMYDYVIELSDGTKLYYTSHLGLINDKDNQRHVFISDTEWLNEVLGVSGEEMS